jgi:predicted dehydrogenase
MNRRDFAGRTACVALASLSAPLPAALAASTARKPLRVALIGAAHAHAVGKLIALQDLSADFEIVGVHEPDVQLRAKLESNPKIRKFRWLTGDEAFNRDVVQAAVVETSVREVVATARRCVDAGLPVHVEKPAGESLSEFSALLDAAQRQNAPVQMGYMLRYNPAFQFCLRAVRKGWLGEVFEASGAISKLASNEMRRELAEYRGGAMFELGCHLIDFVVALLGAPDNVTAVGVASRAPQETLLDNQLAVLRYPRAIASIRSTLLEPQGQRRRQLTVVGDNGTVAIRPLEPPVVKLTLEKPAGDFLAGEHHVPLPPTTGRYHDQLREFAAVIRNERNPSFTGEHDLAVHRTVLQASDLPVDRHAAEG